jgi:NAD(P)-dependent dehydrogenase (short-subunit alcohol dehydrogenase family)
MIGLDQLFSVSGKVALVTGGGRGIGLMMTEALVASGAKVYIASRKREVCEKVAAELGGADRCIGLGADLSSEEGVVGLADELKRREDRLDILVNNSGASWGAAFEEFPWHAWNKVLELNLTAPFVLTRELVPLLANAGTADDPARVVNIGSMLGTVTTSWTAYSYAASKAGLHHITRILSNELANRHITVNANITVNAIAPGPFDTKMTKELTQNETVRQAVADGIPLKRWGAAEDAAGAVLFLCSRAGAYVSGAIVPLDGGANAKS